METRFENARTIEQLKAETQSQKLFFSYASKKDDMGVNQPLYIKDADGNFTKTRAVAVSNEAGKTVAWCSREVSAEVAEGKNPALDARGLSVVDVIDTQTGSLISTKLVHRGNNNVIEGLSL